MSRPTHPLPLRAEIRRQARRRRTWGTFAVLYRAPTDLGGRLCDRGRRCRHRPTDFRRSGSAEGANLVVFTLFASTGFLLIVIVALFAGDTVPSEASWSACGTCCGTVRRSG